MHMPIMEPCQQTIEKVQRAAAVIGMPSSMANETPH